MRHHLVLAIALGFVSSATAQTFRPVPDDDEGGAPRPPRAVGIPSALAVEAAQVSNAACRAVGLKTTALIVDSVGAPIAMISDDEAAQLTQRLASGKAVTAVKLRMSSMEARKKGETDAAFKAKLVADPTMGPPRGGAFPIIVGGKTLGAIAVSGAPTGAEDEPCAKVGLALITGRLQAASAGGEPTKPGADAISFVLPEDIKFEGAPGETRAKLYGDPEKSGPYAILYKWEPGHHSKPHYHSVDRTGYVISGTWWMSDARIEDSKTLYPVPAGSFVTHKAGQVHWDGAVDSTALVLVTGMGPINTTRLPSAKKP